MARWFEGAEQQEVAAHVRMQLGAVGVAVEVAGNGLLGGHLSHRDTK